MLSTKTKDNERDFDKYVGDILLEANIDGFKNTSKKESTKRYNIASKAGELLLKSHSKPIIFHTPQEAGTYLFNIHGATWYINYDVVSEIT